MVLVSTQAGVRFAWSDPGIIILPQKLWPRVGHLCDDEFAADVGEDGACGEEHAARVPLENVGGGGQHPDVEQHQRHHSANQRSHRLAQTSVLTSPVSVSLQQ